MHSFKALWTNQSWSRHPHPIDAGRPLVFTLTKASAAMAYLGVHFGCTFFRNVQFLDKSVSTLKLVQKHFSSPPGGRGQAQTLSSLNARGCSHC